MNSNNEDENRVIFDDNEDTFVNPTDVVEVEVDDDNVPMEEDDDDTNNNANDNPNGNENDENDNEMSTADDDIPDMSIQTITSHKPSSVYAIASHAADGTSFTLVSGGGDDRAFLHTLQSDTKTLATIPLAHAHTDSVSCVSTNYNYVSSDLTKTPKNIAVGSYDGSIIIYNDQGAELQTLDGPTDVEFISFHPKGGSVLLAGSIADATVWMYHLPTSKCLQVFVGHECNSEGGGVTAGSFTPDGKFAVTVGIDGSMRIWAPRTGLCKHVFKLSSSSGSGEEYEMEGPSGLTCLSVNGGHDGQLAIAGGEDGSAHVVHLQGKKVVATLRHFDKSSMQQQQQQGEEVEEMIMLTSVEAVGFAPKEVNCHWVATGGSDGILKVWDLTHGNGSCRQICKLASSTTAAATEQEEKQEEVGEEAKTDSTPTNATTGGITRLKWHLTLPLIFVSYSDGIVRLWDARDGVLIYTLSGGRGSGDENQINDFTVEITNLNNGTGGVACVATANDDGTVKVFEFDVGKVMDEASSK